MFLSIWQYRFFILSSVRNDLINRFANSKLGGLWTVINPLSQVAIYALILSNILAAKLPGVTSKYAYAVYLMAGLLAWSLFSEVMNRCLSLFVEQGNVMKKMNFPRITLPIIVVGSTLLNNILLFSAMLVIFVILGHGFTMAIFWLLPLTFLLAAFALGLGLILGIMNVFLRDIGHLLAIVLQVWFWFTPIVYPITIIPEQYRYLLKFNPMYFFVEAYHAIIVYGNAPQLDGLVMIAVLTLCVLSLSFFMFRRANEEMVDVL